MDDTLTTLAAFGLAVAACVLWLGYMALVSRRARQVRAQQGQPAPATKSTPTAPSSTAAALPEPPSGAGAVSVSVQAPPRPVAPSLGSSGALEPLPLAQWWPSLIEALHVRIIGPTASGKSTLAQALAADSEGSICVLDPVWRPGSWGGLPVVTVADDGEYGPIESAIAALLGQMKRRGAALKQGKTDFERLTILWDEVPDTIAEVPDAGRLVRRVGQRGRHVGMRLIAMGQSDRVKAWGLEGYGDAALNFATVYLGRAAVDQCPALAGAERPAALDLGNGQVVPISLAGLLPLAQRPIDRGRAWPAPHKDSASPACEPPDVPSGPVATEGSPAQPGAAPGCPESLPGLARLTESQRDAMIRRMAGRGWTVRRIAQTLRQAGVSIAQDRLADLCREGRQQHQVAPAPLLDEQGALAQLAARLAVPV